MIEMHRNVKIDTKIFQNGQAFAFWLEEPGSSEVMVWKKLSNGKMRTVFNNENHQLLIFEGIDLRFSTETPELERCRDAVYNTSK